MTISRIGAAVCAAALGLGLAAGCGTDDDGDTIRIGIKFDQPGLSLKEGNDYSGLDVEVARYVAEHLGYADHDIEWVQATSAERESMLEDGRVDLIAATYSITDERREQVGFAGPYYIAGQDLLVREDDNTISGPDSLNGKRLCSVAGSTSAQKLKGQVPGVNLQEFSTYSECIAALISGAIDAITTDDVILAGYAAQQQFEGELEVVGEPFSEERYGVGYPKDQTGRCEEINEAITEMIADGTWSRVVEENFAGSGFTPGDENPPRTEPCS